MFTNVQSSNTHFDITSSNILLFFPQIWYLVFIVIYAYLLVVDHKKVCAINSTSSIGGLEIFLFLFVVGTLPTEILQVQSNFIFSISFFSLSNVGQHIHRQVNDYNV